MWRRYVESKITLQLYSNKISIRDEEICCKSLGALILFQCRTNTLSLQWRLYFAGGAMDYQLCGAVEETVAHFVTECAVLENVRERFRVTREDALKEILLFIEKVDRSIWLLEEMWKKSRREMDRQRSSAGTQRCR